MVSYKYDDDAHIDETRDVVFCWLRDEKTGDRVRVEATREFFADNWKIEWRDKRGLVEEFKKRRGAYVEDASMAVDSGGEFKIYVITR
jgi:hypothetical protein